MTLPRCCLLSFAALATACDTPAARVEPIIEPPPDWCAQAPVTTWSNFGEGFLTENCQPCHATSSVDRHEAPESVTFDGPADVSRHRARILINATGDEPDMPPAGGVSAEDRARLEAWLLCDFDPQLEPLDDSDPDD